MCMRMLLHSLDGKKSRQVVSEQAAEDDKLDCIFHVINKCKMKKNYHSCR